jgi:hypothetical protein
MSLLNIVFASPSSKVQFRNRSSPPSLGLPGAHISGAAPELRVIPKRTQTRLSCKTLCCVSRGWKEGHSCKAACWHRRGSPADRIARLVVYLSLTRDGLAKPILQIFSVILLLLVRRRCSLSLWQLRGFSSILAPCPNNSLNISNT